MNFFEQCARKITEERFMDDASLLGALLFTGPELDRTWSARLAEHEKAVDRLSPLGASHSFASCLI